MTLTLNRAQRRRFDALPSTTPIKIAKALTDKAHAITTDRMVGTFGNKLSASHNESLYRTSGLFSFVALKLKTGRLVADMPTGAGKTTSVVSWLAAVHRLKLDISVTIAASQVESLAKMVRDLKALGVPAATIGLVHAKEYCQEKAEAFLEKGEYSILGDKFASEPITEDNDSRPFLFVTHQRVRAATDDSHREHLIRTYNGRNRDLLIWDEVCHTSAPSAAPLLDVRSGLGALKPYLSEPKVAAALKMGIGYVDSCANALEAELQRQCDGAEPKPVKLAALAEQELETYSRLLQKQLGEEAHAFPAIKMLLEASGQELRIARLGETKSALVSFRVIIPPSLGNMVILDAGHVVNRLVALDTTIHRDPWFQDMADNGHHLKTYQDVTVHFGQEKSGRAAMEDAFGKRVRDPNGFASKIVKAIADIPRDQGVIVFTFKERRRSKVSIPDTLKRELRSADIDPDTLLPNGKRRIEILTWGKHTSLNEYAHAQNVVFAGILHLDDETLMAWAIGQTGDLCKPLEDMPSVSEIKRGDLCGSLYQALSRGSCRYTVNGRAKPMNVWLTHHDTKIKDELERVMPGLTWKDWDVGNSREAGKAETITLQISALLRDTSGDRISNRAIKASLGLENTPTTTFKRAIRSVEVPGWKRTSQAFVREGTAPAYGFSIEV